MATIYRVQTPSGIGPYRPEILSAFDECPVGDLPEYVTDGDTIEGDRPHYTFDGFPRHFFPENREEIRFGFATPEHLVAWFLPTNEDAAVLAEYAHLEVAAYTVDDAEVIRGNRQVAFNIKAAQPLTRFALDDFRALVV